jgi:glyoxylase-like metal-dependent hydrolase (beta-lactamase superfamily II)
MSGGVVVPSRLAVIRITFVVLISGCGARPEAQGPTNVVQAEKWWESLPRAGYATLELLGTYGDWFEVYRLTEDTYAIYEPYQFQEAISYLVLGEQRAALVDTGNGIGDIHAVVSELTDLPVIVLLTHEHPDHYGGASAFEEVALLDIPEAIERVEAGVPNERARRSITGDEVWHPLPEGVDAETFHVPGVVPTRLLTDGEIVRLGARDLEVIATPGHSPGSVCYLDRDRRLLFTGDHFYPGPLYAFGGGVDLETYLASNDRIAARVDEYDHVLSGHNEPWVPASVIARVSEAFRTILDGGADYEEDDTRRRYRFDGFDIIVRKEQLEGE